MREGFKRHLVQIRNIVWKNVIRRTNALTRKIDVESTWGWLRHSSTRHLAFSISFSRILFLSTEENLFPLCELIGREGTTADIRAGYCCQAFFPRNIAKRAAIVCVSISAKRKMALCRSWIDFAVICVTMDYSLFHFPSIWTHFCRLPSRGRDLWKDCYDLILNRNPEDRVTHTNFSQ